MAGPIGRAERPRPDRRPTDRDEVGGGGSRWEQHARGGAVASEMRGCACRWGFSSRRTAEELAAPADAMMRGTAGGDGVGAGAKRGSWRTAANARRAAVTTAWVGCRRRPPASQSRRPISATVTRHCGGCVGAGPGRGSWRLQGMRWCAGTAAGRRPPAARGMAATAWARLQPRNLLRLRVATAAAPMTRQGATAATACAARRGTSRQAAAAA